MAVLFHEITCVLSSPNRFYSPSRIKASFLEIYSPSSLKKLMAKLMKWTGLRTWGISRCEFFMNIEFFCAVWTSSHEYEVAHPITVGWANRKPGRKTAWLTLFLSFSLYYQSGQALLEVPEIIVFQPDLWPWGIVERHQGREDAFITCWGKLGKKGTFHTAACECIGLLLDFKYFLSPSIDHIP